jgi:hypothetical protein
LLFVIHIFASRLHFAKLIGGVCHYTTCCSCYRNPFVLVTCCVCCHACNVPSTRPSTCIITFSVMFSRNCKLRF